MKFDQFCDCLFPGDEKRGLACFSNCNITLEKHLSPETIGLLENLLQEALANKNFDKMPINDIIKEIQRDNKILLDHVLSSLLEAYFSCESTIKVLRPDAVTLFPNHRSLHEIDYDLLANVLNIKINN
jgi:hypothetical protein